MYCVLYIIVYCTLITNAMLTVLAFSRTSIGQFYIYNDDVIKLKHFPRYWPFVRGINRSPVNSSHKGQWCGALMFSLICAWINGWVNNRQAGDMRRNRVHYDVTVMSNKTRSYLMSSVRLYYRYVPCILHIHYKHHAHGFRFFVNRHWPNLYI